MNKEWSELNCKMQFDLKKRETFSEGIETLLRLRKELFDEILRLENELSPDEMCAAPFLGAKGYHSKTIAYSLWHIFRIEDITAHTLIAGDEQVFFKENYRQRTNSPIITTGNELEGEAIVSFSKALYLEGLFDYVSDTYNATNKLIKSLSYDDMKVKVSEERQNALTALNVVDCSEDAVWLIDYWCGKDTGGLVRMPFSRHIIMHAEACLRIEERLKKLRAKKYNTNDKQNLPSAISDREEIFILL